MKNLMFVIIASTSFWGLCGMSPGERLPGSSFPELVLNNESTIDDVLKLLANPSVYTIRHTCIFGVEFRLTNIGHFSCSVISIFPHSIPDQTHSALLNGSLLGYMCAMFPKNVYSRGLFKNRWIFTPTNQTEGLLEEVMKALTIFSTQKEGDFNFNLGEDLGDTTKDNPVTREFYWPLKWYIRFALTPEGIV